MSILNEFRENVILTTNPGDSTNDESPGYMYRCIGKVSYSLLESSC